MKNGSVCYLPVLISWYSYAEHYLSGKVSKLKTAILLMMTFTNYSTCFLFYDYFLWCLYITRWASWNQDVFIDIRVWETFLYGVKLLLCILTGKWAKYTLPPWERHYPTEYTTFLLILPLIKGKMSLYYSRKSRQYKYQSMCSVIPPSLNNRESSNPFPPPSPPHPPRDEQIFIFSPLWISCLFSS